MKYVLKRIPTHNEIQTAFAVATFGMTVIMYNVVSDGVNDLRTYYTAQTQFETYDSCRIIGFVSDIDNDGKHRMSYICKTEHDKTVIIDEREMLNDYAYLNQKIRIMRNGTVLTQNMNYVEYYR